MKLEIKKESVELRMSGLCMLKNKPTQKSRIPTFGFKIELSIN